MVKGEPDTVKSSSRSKLFMIGRKLGERERIKKKITRLEA